MESFALPISFLTNKRDIEEHLLADLELLPSEESPSLYQHVFNPKSAFGEKTLLLWAKSYTSNKMFLRDSQKLMKSDLPTVSADNKPVADIWDNIEKETGFAEKYQYIDWPWFKHLNNSSSFLQCLSLYNMAAPVISLVLPIFFLIIPFFLLKLQGITITVAKYIEVLKAIFQRHQIGQMFSVTSASWDKRVYILISFVFYILQVYQNIISCLKFCKNMKTIHEELFEMRDYIEDTLDNMDQFEKCCTNLKTYSPFIATMKLHREHLLKVKLDLDKISPNKMSLQKIGQIGHLMMCYYKLYNNTEYHNTLQYSFGFTGYLENLQGLKQNIKDKKVNVCKLTKGKTRFKGAYFPPIIKDAVKNSYNLDKHLLITGPNAAGKTTMLKTTIFNLLLSQQMGCGFYDSAKIAPFDFIHCYINIPDTSGRDSLFQAEARRCKNILTVIQDSGDNMRHFCVFDELYSGTNPYEAIGSAASFLRFLNKRDNISFIITTHFIDLCKRLDAEERVSNCHMETKSCGTDFDYTYKLQTGISSIKGGVKVLNDLEYPIEIIEGTQKIIADLVI